MKKLILLSVVFFASFATYAQQKCTDMSVEVTAGNTTSKFKKKCVDGVGKYSFAYLAIGKCAVPQKCIISASEIDYPELSVPLDKLSAKGFSTKQLIYLKAATIKMVELESLELSSPGLTSKINICRLQIGRATLASVKPEMPNCDLSN